jgi:hypothetical protein
MEVARALSSQKPGDRESCLSLAILDSLFSTSKKSLQNRYAISQSLYLFYCHTYKGKKKQPPLTPPKEENYQSEIIIKVF